MERPAKGIHIVPSVSTRPKSARVQSAPTSGDKELLIVAQSAEMAVHDLYKNAVAKAGFAGDELATIDMFAEHHLAYAQAIGGLLGSEAPFERSETIYQQFVAATSSSATAGRTLQALENTLAATHTDILSRLEGSDGAELVASIISVEARHAALFGVLPTLSLSSALDNPASSLLPPAAAATTPTTTETTVEQ